MKSAHTTAIVAVSLLIVGALYIAEQQMDLIFFAQSLLKVALFSLLPIVCAFLFEKSFHPLWNLRGLTFRDIRLGLLVGGGAFVMVLIGYALFAPFIDTASIKSGLESGVGVTRENFFYISAYVVIVNSFLEEFFFRGVLFLHLVRGHRYFAYAFSAGLFALYHVAIIGGWFNPFLMALALSSLFTIGIVFNYLNEKNGHILNSWIAHALADSAIILVGARVFGII